MKDFTLRIPEKLHKEIEAKADRRGQSKSTILRNAAWDAVE